MAEDRNTSGPIRVLLADDHTMFRQELAGVLASYGSVEILADVPNDARALELARELSPDVVIMQVQMPFERAVATLQAMRAFPDPPKVVIVTMFKSPRYVRALTGAGASAYLVKTSSSEHLVATVRAAVSIRRGRTRWWGCLQRCSRRAQMGWRGCSLPGSWRSCFWRPEASPTNTDSLLAFPRLRHRQAAPGQRLPEDGGRFAHRGG